VLLSGGIDSATALLLAKETYNVRALTFEYHGVAASELKSARAIASWAGIAEHRFVRVPDLREAADIPGARFDGLPSTYIPLRNSVFYSFAASYGEEVRASAIVGGHNRDDATVFADVSQEFFASLEKAFRMGSPIQRRLKLRLLRPLQNLTKAQVVRLASMRGVPLGLTWSCHRDGRRHCWKCAGCLSRRAAFEKAGVEDPLTARGGKVT
jgi:7-cyano-7-deazaguanine synthase